MITNNDRQKIEKYLANQNNIDVAYLFGSQSNGKAGVLSDIDIALLFDIKLSVEERFAQKLKVMGDLGIILMTNFIDVVDLNSADTALQFSAIENRDLLFVKNNLSRSIFESSTMTKYQDYKYYLTANTNNSLASISRMEI
jgi:predicted nucleotidyltransferase